MAEVCDGFYDEGIIEALRKTGNWSAFFAGIVEYPGDVSLRYALHALLLY
jgi:hypothetical protein